MLTENGLLTGTNFV